MYAVMKTGGKQYRVKKGDVLRVEKLHADEGESVQFNDILVVGGDDAKVGTPLVDGAAVQAEVLSQMKGPKVIHFVRRRRKHSSKRTKGHRQELTEIRVTDILSSGGASTGMKVAIGAGLVAAAAVVAGVAVAATRGKDETRAETMARRQAKRAQRAAEDAAETVAETAGSAAEQVADAAEGAWESAVDATLDGERPENLLDEAREGGPDDLKRISGVGPKLEQKLHDIGVYHFDQIAAWGPEEIAYMDDRLSFKGRIERDDWIGQAKAYAAEKE